MSKDHITVLFVNELVSSNTISPPLLWFEPATPPIVALHDDASTTRDIWHRRSLLFFFHAPSDTNVTDRCPRPMVTGGIAPCAAADEQTRPFTPGLLPDSVGRQW